MPKKIIPSAYFKVWGKKKKLGKIVFSDKTCSDTVWTKTMAFQELIRCKDKLIWEVEAGVVTNQINESPLPMHASEDKAIIVYAKAITLTGTLIHNFEDQTKTKKYRYPKDILNNEDDQKSLAE